jgi:two-component system OmpR family response regulator
VDQLAESSDMQSPLVLVVDDEEGVRDLIVDALSMVSINTITANHGMQALNLIRENNVDLVVLDVNMPVMDGFEVLEKLRSTGNNLPVIILTARLDREDIKQGFDLGADDFVRKPFGIEELTLRINAVLRRASSLQETGSTTLSMGGLIMDIEQHLVTVDSVETNLSATEFRLLQLFLEAPNKVLSKDQILSQVWGSGNFADPNVVETYVSYLRKKLGSAINLRTIRGVGYQFMTTAGN